MLYYHSLIFTSLAHNSDLIEAIIGLSIVYKALDNIRACQRWLGFQPNTNAARLIKSTVLAVIVAAVLRA